MNLLSQIRRFLSPDRDLDSSTTAARNKAPATLKISSPINASRDNSEPDTIADDDLTVPELPIISEDIRLADDSVGFDPYDSAGEPGASG
tara:strand:+ start:2909 stop:3178 length:270 start_codon:yes stop_codon:yes gene_type:complete